MNDYPTLWIFLAFLLSCAVATFFKRALAKSRYKALDILIKSSLILISVFCLISALVGTNFPITVPFGEFFELYFARLSLLVSSFVSLIGLIVFRFSERYLDGEPNIVRFKLDLSGAILSALLLVCSGTLILFALSWVLVSAHLHKLLTFYSERPRAVLAAKKKFIISRIGDAGLLLSTFVIFKEFGTVRFVELFRIIQSPLTDTQLTTISIAAFGFVLAAMCKSAQLPFHSWLPDTLECPTPVSALMHAGIVNGGGFLLIRMSPLLIQSHAALNTLVLVGSITAFFGTLVMWTQTSIKKYLAWSTVSQMGFMILQCGLGAFSLAFVHIIAHGFYKAHAFLLSGTLGRALVPKVPEGSTRTTFFKLSVGFLLSLLAIAITQQTLGQRLSDFPGGIIALVVFSLALGQTFTLAKGRLESFTAGVLCLVITATCLVFEKAVGHFLTLEVVTGPDLLSRNLGGKFVLVVSFLTFLTLSVLTQLITLSTAMNSLMFRLHVHMINGFYFGLLADRLVYSISKNFEYGDNNGKRESGSQIL